MNIYSMTGYAALQRAVGGLSLHLELRGVNARFLDISFRSADDLRVLESALREKIVERIGRGKLECRINLLPSVEKARELIPNATLLSQLANLEAAVRHTMPQAALLSVSDILRWPGMLAEQALSPEDLKEQALALMDEVLAEFIETRAREGAKLANAMRGAAQQMRELAARVPPLLSVSLKEFETRISAKLHEAVVNLDSDRIRQEVGVLAVRLDVSEELARLTTHIDELLRILDRGGAVGKRLDFLAQELNREANTLAAKSISTEITAIALDLKLLIETVREQVQNLE